jgi:hypothetical protein
VQKNEKSCPRMRLELSLVNLTHKKRKESASPVSQVIQIPLIQLICYQNPDLGRSKKRREGKGGELEEL